MKKILLLATSLALIACSSDDAQPILPRPNNSEPTTGQEYKMFMYEQNIDLENFTFKTKTGNGQWTEQQLHNWRIPVHEGDSIHISSNGQYVVGSFTYIKFQVNTHVDWFSHENFCDEVRVYDDPIDRKIKLTFL